MIYFTDEEIDQLIMEDVQYNDLTTSLLKLENKPAKIQISTQEPTVVCCTEEVMKIFNRTGVQTTLFTPSGEFLEKDVKFLEAEGLSGTLFAIARVIENLLQYSSGVATRTRKLVEKARQVNKNVIITTTRKTIPYTRKIAIKAVKSGGAAIYRYGLSESIVIYKDHYKFLKSTQKLEERLKERRQQTGGRLITVEVETVNDVPLIAGAGADAIQLNNIPAGEIKKLKKEMVKMNPAIRLIAAGEISPKNISEYASSGADILVTSWPYHGDPALFSVNISPLDEIF